MINILQHFQICSAHGDKMSINPCLPKSRVKSPFKWQSQCCRTNQLVPGSQEKLTLTTSLIHPWDFSHFGSLSVRIRGKNSSFGQNQWICFSINISNNIRGVYEKNPLKVVFWINLIFEVAKNFGMIYLFEMVFFNSLRPYIKMGWN